MNMQKFYKYSAFLFGLNVLLIIAAILFYLLLPFPNHQVQAQNYVKISGTVEFSGTGSLIRAPQTVNVYSAYENPPQPCKGNLLGVTEINWKNEKNGTYYLPLGIPVDMDVIVTTKCSGHHNESVLLRTDEVERVIDLSWDNREIEEEGLTADFDSIITKVESLNDSTRLNMAGQNFTETQYNELKTYSERSERARIDAKENDSLEKANAAMAYAIYTKLRFYTFDLNNCIIEIETNIADHNSHCYQLPYKSYSEFENSKKWYIAIAKKRINEEVLNDVNLPIIRQHLQELDRDLDHIITAKDQCYDQKREIEESMKFQESYCESLNRLNFAHSAIFAILGFAIALATIRWFKNDQK